MLGEWKLFIELQRVIYSTFNNHYTHTAAHAIEFKLTCCFRCGGCGKYGMIKTIDYVKQEENDGFKETVTYTRMFLILGLIRGEPK